MESLDAELYNNYHELKKVELNEINKDKELKFLNYVAAAEDLIEYNAKLCEQVNNLKTEVDSLRSTNNQQCMEYQSLVMQERQKNKALSQEVERLQKLYQSHWQLVHLRVRDQRSATNIDDCSRRIINRLLFALSELPSMESVTVILHTCATLDMATEHSWKCCEKLVAAEAIGALLKLLHLGGRSIPNQEVLKHALSTVRNLTQDPHLIEVLIDSYESVEIIFLYMLRNEGDGHFIPSHILKRIWSNHKGIQATFKLPAHLERFVEQLTRRANLEKRNTQSLAMRENTERRLREATELLILITHG